MTTYTKESLKNINKKDLIPTILSPQNKLEEVNNNVLVEMRRLNESFSKSQAEVSMRKQVNILLSSRLVSIERHSWLKLVGIPSEVEGDALEEKVVAIFVKLGCNISIELVRRM